MAQPLLTLKVVAGKNLAAKDDNGLSDPYCVLRVSNGLPAKRTKVIKKTLNPTWNQEFYCGAIDPSVVLKLTCWDQDTFSSDDFMGQFTINFAEYCKPGQWSFWKVLEGRGKNEEISGEIQVTIKVELGDPKKKKASSSSSSSPAMSAPEEPVIPVARPVDPTKAIFGVELQELMRRQQHDFPGIPVPVMMFRMINFVSSQGTKEEGIFRLAGVHTRMKELKEMMNAGESVDVEAESIHDIAGLIKTFLRELPTPLLTFEMYTHVLVRAREGYFEDEDRYLEAIKLVVAQIPAVHRELTKMIVDMLHRITTNSAINKMSTQNLVICLSPNVLWAPNAASSFEDMHKISNIVMNLVEQKDYIFTYDIQPAAQKPPPVASRVQTEARRLFQTYDINGDGHMDREEFSVFYRDTLIGLGMPPPTESDIDSAISVLDKDKNNEISLEEFESWWQMMQYTPSRPQRRRGGPASPSLSDSVDDGSVRGRGRGGPRGRGPRARPAPMQISKTQSLDVGILRDPHARPHGEPILRGGHAPEASPSAPPTMRGAPPSRGAGIPRGTPPSRGGSPGPGVRGGAIPSPPVRAPRGGAQPPPARPPRADT